MFGFAETFFLFCWSLFAVFLLLQNENTPSTRYPSEMLRKSLLLQISQLNKLHCRFNQNSFSSEKTHNFPLFPNKNDDPLYVDVPKPRTDKSERKPYATPMKELIKRAKQEKELRKAQPCRLLEHPPANGLLVPELVDFAHRVYRAHEFLLFGLSKLVRLIPVQRCR